MLRPVRCEAAEDGDGARGGGRLRGPQVQLPVLIGGQEMVGRPVMSGLVVTPWVPAENVGGQPVNLVSPRIEAIPRVLYPGRGDIKDGEVAEAAIQQRPGERGCAAAHVDQGISGRDPGRGEHPKRHARMVLEPTPGVISLGMGSVPVRRCLSLASHIPIVREARASQLAGAHHDQDEPWYGHQPACGHSPGPSWAA